jgi:Asp-tRNA(Asn)/Glu-tRNA(Gln) amidotransferase A subunit family amidase
LVRRDDGSIRITEHYLERAGRLSSPIVNAYVALNGDARAAPPQSAARLRTGRLLSRIDGIPAVAKEDFLVRALPAT